MMHFWSLLAGASELRRFRSVLFPKFFLTKTDSFSFAEGIRVTGDLPRPGFFGYAPLEVLVLFFLGAGV